MKIIQKNKNRTEQRQSLPENGAATIAAKEVKEEKKTRTPHSGMLCVFRSSWPVSVDMPRMPSAAGAACSDAPKPVCTPAQESVHRLIP